jgi:hypothetical protein
MGGATKILTAQCLILLDIVQFHGTDGDRAVRYYLGAGTHHAEGV